MRTRALPDSTHLSSQTRTGMPKGQRRLSAAVASLALLMVMGCSQAPQGDQFAGMTAGSDNAQNAQRRAVRETSSAAPGRSGGATSCLLLVWDAAPSPDVQFDRANDAVEGGTISCGVGTSPSQLNQALEKMNKAAAADDRAALAQMLAPKLTFIDREGNRTSYADGSRVEEDLDAIFAPDVLSVLAKAELSQVTVVPDQGAFLALGGIWLATGETGGVPQIRTINRQALVEAQGTPGE